jgi:hypothetical protein
MSMIVEGSAAPPPVPPMPPPPPLPDDARTRRPSPPASSPLLPSLSSLSLLLLLLLLLLLASSPVPGLSPLEVLPSSCAATAGGSPNATQTYSLPSDAVWRSIKVPSNGTNLARRDGAGRGGGGLPASVVSAVPVYAC